MYKTIYNHFATSTKAKRYARSKMAISKCFGFVKMVD